jgi:hypothetical protein
VLDLAPLLVRVGVPDDAAAHAVLGLPALAVDPHRPDGDVEFHRTVGGDCTDGARVDAAAVTLQRLDDLRGPDLGGAGDRGAGEQGVEDLAEADVGVGHDRRGHGVDRGVGLDRVQRRHPDRPRVGNAPQVVADHVDDHGVLGQVLLGPGEVLGGEGVPFGVGVPADGARRPDDDAQRLLGDDL